MIVTICDINNSLLKIIFTWVYSYALWY